MRRSILLLLIIVSVSFCGSIIAVGDVMLGSSYPNSTMLDSCPKGPLRALSQIGTAPVMLCNIEGTFLDQGSPSKSCNNCFSFRMPESYAHLIRNVGFNVVSLANNHSQDFGYNGILSTTNLMKNQGIHYASYKEPWDTFTIDGVKYGYCAFNTAWHRIMEAGSIIRSMIGLCSILIVSMHGSAEGNGHTHVPKRSESYYGENRGDVYRFSHMCVDDGADIILGHGPHVPRALELYKGRLIAYSLGNFSTCGFKLEGATAVAPVLWIEYSSSGDFVRGRIYPIRQDKYRAPVIDSAGIAIKMIRELTMPDFPKTKLSI